MVQRYYFFSEPRQYPVILTFILRRFPFDCFVLSLFLCNFAVAIRKDVEHGKTGDDICSGFRYSSETPDRHEAQGADSCGR